MRTGSTVVLNQNVAARRIHPAPGADKALEPGVHLDRYLILERIGGGGMGVVYRARDTELDREVALKVLTRAQCQQPDALNRFRAEAQAQARLRSPHVVTLYSLLELPVGAVLVLEYVQGQTLERRLRAGGPLAPEEAVAVFDQALLGLEHVHEMGVIHRDIKPSNLFLTSTGIVKIMDFSVARLAARDAYPPRTMVGTLLYIAPEQISGRATDVRSDIYALGMTLYEAVTGRLPFERRTDYGLMHAHVQEHPPKPSDFAPLSSALERVILKAIEKEPEQRYASAADFRAALLKAAPASYRRKAAALPANAYGPVPPGKTGRRSPRQICAAILFDLLLVAGLAGFLYVLTLRPTAQVVAETPAVEVAPAKRPAVEPARTNDTVDRPKAAPTPTRREPAPPAPDRYNPLREAWGN